MPSHVIDATLAVEATSIDFPVVFPITFGPDATGTINHYANASLPIEAILFADNEPPGAMDAIIHVTASTGAEVTLDGSASTTMAITATFLANSGKDYFCDVELVVTTYSVFPYVFPFVFEQTLDTLSRGQTIDVDAIAALVDFETAGTRGAVGDSSQDITASSYVTAISGGEHPADVALTATALTAATLGHGQPIQAAQQIQAQPAGDAVADMLAHVVQAITANYLAIAGWAAHGDVQLEVTSSKSATVTFGATINTAFTIAVHTVEMATRGQFVDATLTATAHFLSGPQHAATVDADLTVSAIRTVTTPLPTGFWDFYLR